MLCLVSPEQFVPKGHPLREIKSLADEVLKHLNPVFDRMYARRGRPSIPPETLLRSSLLMALYTIRSERQFCEQLGYNLMFRWFLDMDMTDEPFDASTFSKNRDRMLEHDVAREFFQLVVESARSAHLLSQEHFTVDGTLIEAWASMKSFRPKEGEDRLGPPDDPGNPTVNFRGEKRRNETHASTTDPEAKLYRKAAGQQAKLCFGAHALMENRNGCSWTSRSRPPAHRANGSPPQRCSDERMRERARPWARTRATTSRTSSPGVGRSDLRPMSLSGSLLASMAEQLATRATRSANGSGSGWRRSLAG